MSNQEEIKRFLAEDELLQIRDFKLEYDNIAYALGENRLKKESLLSSYHNLTNQEQDFYNRLTIKYGKGSIDLTTGEIVNE